MLLFYLYISLLVFAIADLKNGYNQELEKLISALRVEETEVNHVFKGPFSYERGQILNAPDDFCRDPMNYCKAYWYCRGDWCEKEGGKFSTCVPKPMIREFIAAPHQPTGGTCAPGLIPNLAIETAWFSNAAYDEFNVGVEQYERYGWKFLFDAHDVDSGARAVIWEKSNACLVAFRGTQETINWIANLDVGRVPLSDGIVAHKGFYKHTIKTLEAGLGKFFHQTSGKCSMKKIILTGHSLGGAAAILFTNMLLSGTQNLKMREPKDVQTFTYGQPRAFFNCPAKIHDDQRIHRFFLKKNGITDAVPTMFANIGATFCTKGLEIAWKDWENCCEAGWVETKENNVPVFGLGSVLPHKGVDLHSMEKYFQTVNENGYDYNCETSYE